MTAWAGLFLEEPAGRFGLERPCSDSSPTQGSRPRRPGRRPRRFTDGGGGKAELEGIGCSLGSLELQFEVGLISRFVHWLAGDFSVLGWVFKPVPSRTMQHWNGFLKTHPTQIVSDYPGRIRGLIGWAWGPIKAQQCLLQRLTAPRTSHPLCGKGCVETNFVGFSLTFRSPEGSGPVPFPIVVLGKGASDSSRA